MRPHFLVEGLFNGCVLYEHEVAFVKIEVADDRSVVAFETEGGTVSLTVYLVMQVDQVCLALLKRDSSARNEVGGGEK